MRGDKNQNVQSLNVVLVMGRAKMPITKEKKIELWGSLQPTNMVQKEIRGCFSSPPPMTSPRRK